MHDLICYKTMPEWDINSLPTAFRKKHNTKVGTWAKLTIFSGKLKYYAMDEAGKITDIFIFDKKSNIPFVKPQAWHKVEPLTDDLRCQLAFYCQPDSFYQEKYNLSTTHSEVIETLQIMQSENNPNTSFSGLSALDLGCGGGRNALYLQQNGFNVTAFDKNENAINKLNHIIEQEDLADIQAHIANLHNTGERNELQLKKYNLVVATVVLMFIDEDKIAEVIAAMQSHTQAGGYNVIVCAMDTNDYPLSNYQGLLPFKFGLKSNELSTYYQHWHIKKYNENVGYLHRLDANGNPIALRFATIIAKNLGAGDDNKQ
ncbi:SAM-dependent methyltransferase TehB [Psychrobacter sp. HD31]|uniref:SAM-dependent methyltransferase TehB n=1 Tax=Psychrobacter sp. HD31 TaxID=3112003 RepID=UPI003DA4D6BB